jgi:ketosteroid isomerase-like protein
MDEYKKTWDLFFRYHKPSQAFDIEELAITAGEDVAFAVDGDWRIAHEHHSVPSTD